MFPAQSLAEVMLTQGWRVKLSTDERGARYADGFPDEVDIDVMQSSTFARGGVRAKLFAPFKIIGGIFSAFLKFRKDRPDVVVGFGGYPTIPAMSAAYLMKLPRMLHEQNGVLGRVNELFAKRVDAVACGTWPTNLPEDVEGVYIGNPVRAAILQRHGSPYIAPGDYPMEILVLGGSQGARILSDEVPASLALLPENMIENIRVSHQARAEDVVRVKAFYAEQGIYADVRPFFDDVPKRISEAQLIISRSGASSVADIAIIGRPSILVPFAAATGGHQKVNAKSLTGAGAAIMIPESQLTFQSLSEQIENILSQPEAASQMASAALSVAKPRAAEELAILTMQVAKLRQK